MFSRGDGNDTIYDEEYNYYGGNEDLDTLRFGDDISKDDLVVAIDGTRLVISFEGNDDSITIEDWNNHSIEQLEFSDGTTYSTKPVISNTSVEMFEDSQTTGQLAVVDAFGGMLSYFYNAESSLGTFNIDSNTGEWTYVPYIDANGIDNIVVQVVNEFGLSSEAIFQFMIDPVEDAPIAQDDVLSGSNGRYEGWINVEGSHNYNDGIASIDRWKIEHHGGTLTIDVLTELNAAFYDNTIAYYNDINSNGIQEAFDSYIYLIREGEGPLANRVVAYNDDDRRNGREDGSVHQYDSYLSFNSLEAGNYSLIISIYSLSINEIEANLNGNTGSEYYGGPYRLTFSGDMTVVSGPKEYSEKLVFANDQTATIAQLLLLNNDYDVDSDVLNIVSVQEAVHGSVSLDEQGNILFVPEAAFIGEASFTYTITDGKGGFSTANVLLNVKDPVVNNYATPIVLDLNHNAITSTALATSTAYFDYDGDGNREHTGWAEKGDAMLVADLNNDGVINDGSEHFGNYTKLLDGTRAQDGYEALAHYDSNSDGVIDNRDEAFGNLLLWKDANQNGKTEEGELTNIQTSGILALHLDRANGITFEQTSENGNILLNETNYATLGSSGIMRDVGFAYDPFDTITDNDTLSAAYYGNLLSGGNGDDTYFFTLGDGKITIDDQGDGFDSIRLGIGISKEQLVVKWISGSDDLLIGIRNDIADNRPLSSLENQILIKDFFTNSGSIETIEFNDSTTLSKSELYDLLLDTRDVKNLTARVLEEDGTLFGGTFNDLLYGASGQEIIDGGEGNDYLKGLGNDDYLIGGEGDDTLQGGAGDDTLEEISGDDVYLYDRGDGRDTITDFGGIDTIMFGEGISAQDIVLSVGENDLFITFQYDSSLAVQNRDTIRIVNFNTPGFTIESLEFSNAEVVSMASLLNLAPQAPTEVINTLHDIRILSGNVGATDGEGDVLTYTVSTASAHGTLSINETGVWS
ncbi:MAG: Ig-like domain-containing protein, partial [Sulfuricurvum sp.]|nr:Ig-like domain-containing protein [Sulfuricurvum sp.]